MSALITGMKSQTTISVIVNGAGVETHAFNVAELVEVMNTGETRVATALNGKFVPIAKRVSTTLASGDMIEILSARQGG